VRTILRCLLLFVLGCSGIAWSQAYPNRPVHFVLPYAHGGSYDVIARVLGQKISENWGQQIVVDNRPGAAGRIAMQVAAKAANDGYTVAIVGNTQATVPSIYKDVPYDLVRDFAPVALFGTVAEVLLVNPAVPAKSVAELIQLARQKPGTIHFGSGGTGGITHLAGELFKKLATVDTVHVPYKAGAFATNELLGGQLQMSFLAMAAAVPHVKAGRLRALAVTSLKRSRFAPELPTLDESGLKGYEIVEWFGMVVPAGTPADIIAKLRSELAGAMKAPGVKERFDQLGVESMMSSPEELQRFMKTELAKYAAIAKEANIEPE
jgi:tripartite-type tricarboxylate transporter receptor subunit TctC